jgi:hypothetical protein
MVDGDHDHVAATAEPDSVVDVFVDAAIVVPTAVEVDEDWTLRAITQPWGPEVEP